MSNIQKGHQYDGDHLEVNSIPNADSSVNEEIVSEGSTDRDQNDEEGSIKDVGEEPGSHVKKQSWKEIAMLSFTSLGAIYGDLGTSPLYVLNSMKYSESPPNKEDIYGAVSVIFYVFTIIVIFKYVFIVLVLGPNNGEGGQVAIYAKIARYLNIGPRGVVIPGSPEITDLELIQRQDTTSSFKSANTSRSAFNSFKKNPTVIKCVQKVILFACFLGCALVISDGLLTPTTSVLSAVGGIQIAKPSFNDVLAVSEVILIVLFIVQQLGSHKISFTFAPIIFVWIIGLDICGIYNIAKYHPGIFKALSPYYAIKMLKRGGIDVFSGAMLAITGTEAMFADIGHFGRLPIQLTLGCFVYPSLIICYLGQASYIVVHPEAWTSPFFNTLPGGSGSWSFWIMFVLATLATIIASQALILSVFSIISQLINLDCFPNIKIVHTSKHYVGKVYIPVANWLLMIGVVCATAGFKNSNNVTAAYGLGITIDFLVTSVLISLCIIFVYDANPLWAVLYILFFVPLEIIMVVANLKKIAHGAWFPIMMAGIVLIFLSIWRWASSKKVDYEYKNRIRIGDLYPDFKKVPLNTEFNIGGGVKVDESSIKDLDSDEEVVEKNGKITHVNSKFGKTELATHDGIGVLYNGTSIQNFNSPNTLPQVYSRILKTFSSIPSVFIFCSTRTLSIPYVPDDERVLIGATKLPGHYKCIVRFGFMEEIKIDAKLSEHILNSVPDIHNLMARYNRSNSGSTPITSPDQLPIIHIFENNLIKGHNYNSDEFKTKNPLVKFGRLVRKLTIDILFSPLISLTRHESQYLRLNDEDEAERKLFVGGITRI